MNLTYDNFREATDHIDQILTTRNEANIMSLVGMLPCINGLVLFSDTRCTTRIPGSERPIFKDDEQKIFQVPGTSVCVTLTGSNRFGTNKDTTMGNIVAGLTATSIEDVAGQLSARLLREDSTGQSAISIVDVKKIHGDHFADAVLIRTSQGHHFTMERHLFPADGKAYYHGAEWAVGIADTHRFGVMHTMDAEIAAVELMRMVMGVSAQLDENARVVGGNIEVAVISIGKDGKYEVRHSTYSR